MLHELTISSLGVIDRASVSLGPGLTVVTGETGAGKTMILTGLDLILGGKATPDAVRVGAAEASAEAVLDVPENSAARERAADAGAVIDDDGTVTIVRVVSATTRSRAIVGGRTVPQALLGEIGSELVTVHGQADQVRLRTPARQRETLDLYAGSTHAVLLTKYRDAWTTWREAAKTLEELERSEATERARIDRARIDLDALEAADIQPGEQAELAREAQVLTHSEELRAAAALAHEALAGDREFTASVALESARRALDEAGRHDETLALLATRVADYLYGAADAAQELASYLDRLEADPARLDEINSRLSAISGLERRFGVDADGLIALRESLSRELAAGGDWDEQVNTARQRAAEAREQAESLAVQLTEGRRDAAERLATHVEQELTMLAMADAAVAVRVEPRDLGPHGADEVTMLLAAHPGAPARPIAEAASGGELSRIMLAVEVALAGHGNEGHTFVFDEVDAGVGGKAAQSVGQRLAALARTHQVIVVTHLAQVAAYADRHVVVEKSSDGAVTVSQVYEVSGEDRVREIARLLSGEEDSASARAHALELLEGARMAP
jgi:DNA repair protein RecN (Recombination protein N)